ncbi:prephenate dehydrogenase [Liquorilactobacillus mali]|uniref:Prephenate dehydrogenase n=1 Tax=Liquorilactobacillus mali KCTC 3596 = DSM 20444 TaxID=1046596 RepID=A0A0R2E9J3_9LACO|nr:prephenate dehydrogenase [Liquorilactobacillus mali]KRN08628.1 prephenate dehydrogenase [Liquorilactobacillus mali KCTC 3596 = DSM 20444]MDC7952590.1 prephenate dehydrogenase [Liquorilactobacillus mali]QFQ73732.1 prephenate dehydrogenase [Liquorilactobacillus mali]
MSTTEVFINGLGLIGSSLARAIKKKNEEIVITAADKDKDTLDYAIANKIIDRAAGNLAAVKTADIIILATPVDQIVTTLHELSKMQLKKDAIVTDVGSTKQTVLKAAKELIQPNVTFIGGHPMAGSHKAGVTAGRADLFENAFYFLVAPKAKDKQIEKLQLLLQETNVKWFEVDASTHDKLVGQISHLPHIIAATLVNRTQDEFADSPLGMKMAAGGFKSITRIASSDPDMWSAILKTNTTILTTQLAKYQQQLSEVQDDLKNGNQENLYNLFFQAKNSRDKLSNQKKYILPDFYDLFVNIPDKVGAIARVTQLLACNKINLVNLQILEIREEIDGILQLTFMKEIDYEKAKKILSGQEYRIVKGE